MECIHIVYAGARCSCFHHNFSFGYILRHQWWLFRSSWIFMQDLLCIDIHIVYTEMYILMIYLRINIRYPDRKIYLSFFNCCGQRMLCYVVVLLNRSNGFHSAKSEEWTETVCCALLTARHGKPKHKTNRINTETNQLKRQTSTVIHCSQLNAIATK